MLQNKGIKLSDHLDKNFNKQQVEVYFHSHLQLLRFPNPIITKYRVDTFVIAYNQILLTLFLPGDLNIVKKGRERDPSSFMVLIVVRCLLRLSEENSGHTNNT